MNGHPALDLVTTVPGIRAEAITFSYGSRPVFSDLSFEIPSGEVHALVGRSGIGKTTLLNVVLGLYKPTSGRVLAKHGAIREPGLIKGVVFREDSLLGWLTVLENVLFPHHKQPHPESIQRALALLEETGLSEAARQLPRRLSAGMSKRVELLRALLADNDYFIGDEPFSALDIHTRRTLHNLWRRLRSENPRTGLLCTHDPLEAAQLADVVLVMRKAGDDGRIELEPLRVPDRFRQGASQADLDPFLQQMARLIA